MTASPPHSPRSPTVDTAPVRDLKDAELKLGEARHAAALAAQAVAEMERKVETLKAIVEDAKEQRLRPVRPRRLAVAYALWLFTPFVWPGAYLFYLGRDTHALLHTMSLGGCLGLGWLVDFFYIPLYVRDHNEPPGYLERVRSGARGSAPSQLGGLLVSPVTLAIQVVFAVAVGLVAAYLVPRPVRLPRELATALGAPQVLSKVQSATVGFCVGMLALTVYLKLVGVRLARVRTGCRWRPVLLWAGACSGLLSPSVLVGGHSNPNDPDALALAPGFVIGAVGVVIGVSLGRRVQVDSAPRRCTSRGGLISTRGILQLVGISAFAAAAVGAFYLNGSYTHTDPETNLPRTLSGPEALRELYKGVWTLGQQSKIQLGAWWQQQENKTWFEVLEEIRALFRDPSYEAADLLGVSSSASPREVNKAYKALAVQYHPDKQTDPADKDAATEKMARLNWAKGVLLGSDKAS